MGKFTPNAAQEFLWAVEMVVKGIILPDLTNGRVMSPFEGERSYEFALNIVQGVVKDDWVTVARVIWIDFGLEQWEDFIKRWDDSGSTARVEHLSIEREIGVRLVTLDHYIQTRCLGHRRNQIMDRFINILKWLHEHQGDKTHFRSWARRMLKRRTGLERENDPYVDSLTYSLLCKHFGISE